MRKHKFVEQEYYHVYNRGVDKRSIFEDEEDLERFIETIKEFNSDDCYGGMFRARYVKKKDNLRSSTPQKIVEIVSYCILSNHYHFILKPLQEDGISKFMQRLGTGYTNYFNIRHERSGSLFQGKFKSIHIDSNEYLLRVFAYVSQNHLLHLRSRTPQIEDACLDFLLNKDQEASIPINPDVVKGQFPSLAEFSKYLQNTLLDMVENKRIAKEIKDDLE